MNCSTAKDWLLQAELPGELARAPAEVAEHLRQCEACQRLVHQIGRLERTLKEQPLPATAVMARNEFLRRHDGEPARPSKSPVRRRFAVPRWLVAASVLLAASLTIWFMSGPQQAHAESDVIDRLIDWNLQMSEQSGQIIFGCVHHLPEQAPGELFADHRQRLE